MPSRFELPQVIPSCSTKQAGRESIREYPKIDGLGSRQSTRAQSGVRHQAQARLRLPGQARENKRNMVAGVFAAGTADDHAAALNPTAVARRLQGDRHFRPRIERRGASEFDAAFVNDDRFGGKLQTGLPAFHSDSLLERIRTLKFFGAHRT